ncbi:hypothetical protein ABIE44_000943 [Marmoricola sp. OAE513]|uniref:hypothetical protein n=1 Tax=Marmoricola sp. OAE513 TaxID=2817894 RepID=UPI001AE486F0
MSRATTGWDFADAWVFASIAGHHRPCTLTELIGAADWMNHAILLEAELEGALGKLAGAGLVRVFEDWTFELTDDGISLWTSGTRDMAKQLELVQTQLADLEPVHVEVRLPRGVFARAVIEYQDR